jgi:hypothetical protein
VNISNILPPGECEGNYFLSIPVIPAKTYGGDRAGGHPSRNAAKNRTRYSRLLPLIPEFVLFILFKYIFSAFGDQPLRQKKLSPVFEIREIP